MNNNKSIKKRTIIILVIGVLVFGVLLAAFLKVYIIGERVDLGRIVGQWAYDEGSRTLTLTGELDGDLMSVARVTASKPKDNLIGVSISVYEVKKSIFYSNDKFDKTVKLNDFFQDTNVNVLWQTEYDRDVFFSTVSVLNFPERSGTFGKYIP